jgi:hypothetical protein
MNFEKALSFNAVWGRGKQVESGRSVTLDIIVQQKLIAKYHYELMHYLS